MRAARLLATMLRLHQSGFRTARELADDHEVSVRTVYRDIEALQAAGVPVWTTPGAGGGIHLDRRWRTPIDGLAHDETIALLVGDRRARSAGLDLALRTARSHVEGAATGVTELLSWIDDRFIVDPTPWFQPAPAAETLATLSVIAGAIRTRRRLDLVHRGDSGLRRRRVDPLGLVDKHGTHYLVATHRGSVKTYRVSRISRAHVRDEPATGPDGFDLTEHWSRFVEDFEHRLRPVPARLRIHTSDRNTLRRALPGAATERSLRAATVHDARLMLEITVETVAIAAAQLSSIPSIEILHPPALRHAVAAHCRAIAERHDPCPERSMTRDP